MLSCLLLATGYAFSQSPGTAPHSSETTLSATQAPGSTDHKANDAAPNTVSDKPLSPKEARQAQLVADTKKLYELAEELRVEVAKTNKDTLSLTVVKKAAEVEKLAKSIKERMRSDSNSTP